LLPEKFGERFLFVASGRVKHACVGEACCATVAAAPLPYRQEIPAIGVQNPTFLGKLLINMYFLYIYLCNSVIIRKFIRSFVCKRFYTLLVCKQINEKP
jgi:hypothetical protein